MGAWQAAIRGEPFRMKDFDAHNDTVTWRKRLQRLFTLAGITEVRNELGKARPPHPHMLRDTFAVWHLRHGVPLHAVSKMLGHGNPVTTAKAYLPYVKELEKATIAEARAANSRGVSVDDRGCLGRHFRRAEGHRRPAAARLRGGALRRVRTCGRAAGIL